MVARSVSPDATILRRAAADKAWQPVRDREALSSGARLVSLSRAALESQNGAVRLNLLGVLDQEAHSPVRESAVTLHDNPKVDLDFTLDRGRVQVVNTKDKGEVRVRIRFLDQAWEIDLAEPGAEVAVERFDRWPSGVHFTQKPKKGEAPTADVTALVLHGHADLNTGARQFALSAPPGPASFHWDSVSGPDPGPQRRDQLPDWARSNAPVTSRDKALHQVLEARRSQLLRTPVEQVIAQALESKDLDTRRLAVQALAALGDLAHLADVLADRNQPPEIRETAIPALRHYLGSAAGNDQRLFRFLVEQKKMPPAHAEIIADLLHSPSKEARARPELYETLIEYLRLPDSEPLGIRELAKWHLYRLVPAGKTIKYDPAGSEAEREAAYKAWKKLIPDGKVPPEAK
jgi:hypothetical protein